MPKQPNDTKMQVMDRRIGAERRIAKRYRVNIDIQWEAGEGKRPGTVSDISTNGCFVLCTGEVDDGERIKLYLPLSGGMKVQFNAEVVNHLIEVGFAVRFTDLTPAQKDFVENFVAMHKEEL